MIGAGLAALVRRRLSWAMLHALLRRTMVIWLILGAGSRVGSMVGGNSFLQAHRAGLDLPPLGVIFVMMAILVVLGIFMGWIVAPPGVMLGEIFGSVRPFICRQIIGLLLVMFLAHIVLWLPNTVFG